MDAPAHDDTDHSCSLAGNEKGWSYDNDNNDSVINSDNYELAPVDKWTNGNPVHWDPLFGWTSGYH